MRRLTWPALLLLAGCGLFRSAPAPSLPPEQDTPDHQACRAEADRTPEVRALLAQINPNNTWNLLRLEEQRRAAFQRAYRACLSRRGLSLPGGVEPERFR
jgi:hypothetical protein